MKLVALFTLLYSHSKLASALLLGWALTPIIEFVRLYIFDDFKFIQTLCLVITIDTIFGVWKYYKIGQLSSKGFGVFFGKVITYFLFLIVTHAIAQHKVNGQVNSLLTWLDAFTYSSILVRELLSILENTATIGIFTPPKWILQKLKQFDDNGNFTDGK